jgi:flagellar biosynthesis protein FliP
VTFGAYLTIVGALGLVLMLVGFALAALRKFTGASAGARTRLPLEVVQRVALGPKQGIAIVRVGQRVVAVSVGDGGVRPLMEVDGDDREAVLAVPDAGVGAAMFPARMSLPRGLPAFPTGNFKAAMRTALKSYMLLAALAGTGLVGGAFVPVPAAAQLSQPSPAIASPAVAPPSAPAVAQVDTMMARLAPEIDLRIGDRDQGGLRLSGTVGIVVMMGLLTLLPTLLLMMTSFTRILVVLHFLRQALGTQSAPPAHLMAGLALLLTGFVMGPTLSEVHSSALKPWMEGQIDQGEMLAVGAQPFREFMLEQTRDRDLSTFMEMRDGPTPATADDIPLVVIVSAFVTSELRTAFQIGFALFLPFIVIDVVVASVLMSMGMFMLPPAMISLPFKLLLFVLVDGWSLIVQGLVTSFR